MPELSFTQNFGYYPVVLRVLTPKFTFLRCLEEFLFPLAKIQKHYHTINQLIAIYKAISQLSLFNRYPFLT